MSKLAEYIQVLADEPAEYARWRADGVEAMTRFGLTEHEQHAVLRGDVAALRTELARAQQPKPPEPKPPKPKPPIPLQGYSPDL